MPRALIIDDEPPACEILRALLAEHPSVQVVGEAGTIDDARTQLARGDYDLVFLDIQLRGGTGFDLVPSVRVGAHIVFVTAFDQHALRAFEINALDYILKPVSPERIALSLRRAPAPSSPSPAVQPPPASGPLRLDDRVLLKLSTGTERFVHLADIHCVASCENYSEVFFGNGERVFVRKTMKAWEHLLPVSYFVRAHRHAIVNTRHLTRIERVSVSTSLLHLEGVSEPVRASYRYLPALREKMPQQTPRAFVT